MNLHPEDNLDHNEYTRILREIRRKYPHVVVYADDEVVALKFPNDVDQDVVADVESMFASHHNPEIRDIAVEGELIEDGPFGIDNNREVDRQIAILNAEESGDYFEDDPEPEIEERPLNPWYRRHIELVERHFGPISDDVEDVRTQEFLADLRDARTTEQAYRVIERFLFWYLPGDEDEGENGVSFEEFRNMIINPDFDKENDYFDDDSTSGLAGAASEYKEHRRSQAPAVSRAHSEGYQSAHSPVYTPRRGRGRLR